MRVLADSNVLFSALLFPGGKPERALLHVAANHDLVLCDQNIAELRDVVARKAPDRLADVERFISELTFEMIPAARVGEKVIRDPKDQPILSAAIIAGVDVILTGDKDFLSLNIDFPRCLSPRQYLSLEGVLDC